MMLFVHISNEIKTLILGKGLRQGLDETTLTEEAGHSVNFTEEGKKFYLSLHCNRSNTFFICWRSKNKSIKNKRFWISGISSVLGNISKKFSVYVKKQTGINGYAYDFPVDYEVLMLIL